MPKSKVKKRAKKRGPKPAMLKLSGDWKEAVKFSFTKKRPLEGWPKHAD